ncbi:MAG: DUF1566 domain-containing protein, partial [Candidatus Bipolaricaulota bacterium]
HQRRGRGGGGVEMNEKRRIFCDQGEDPEDLWAECMEHLKNGRGDKVATRLMGQAMERSAFRNAIMHLQAYIRRQQTELEEIHAERATARERIAELEAALDDARRVRNAPPDPVGPSDTPAPPEAPRPPRFTSYEQEQEHSAGFRFSSKRVFVDTDTGLEWFFPFGADGGFGAGGGFGASGGRSVTFKEALQVVEAVAMHGYGWRLPTPGELLYLCKRPGEHGSATMFVGMTRETLFWSSTPSGDAGDYVAVVGPVEGWQSKRHQTELVDLALVRCVRRHEQTDTTAPVPPDRRPTPRSRFTIHHLRQDKPGEAPFDSDLIVYDATTGLEWFRPYPTARSYEGAMDLVGRLAHNRWRLPNESTLTTISKREVRPSDRDDVGAPEWIGMGPWCWSSTVSILNRRPVAFDLNSDQTDDGAQMAHVILVRDYDYTRTQAAGESGGCRHDGLGAREGKEG